MSAKLRCGPRRTLTAELLTDIRRNLRVDTKDISGHRSEPRAAMRVAVDITPYVNDRPAEQFEVWLVDLSASGISILSHSPLSERQQFTMSLPYESAAHGNRLPVLCIVANCRSMNDGTYRIGCSFG